MNNVTRTGRLRLNVCIQGLMTTRRSNVGCAKRSHQHESTACQTAPETNLPRQFNGTAACVVFTFLFFVCSWGNRAACLLLNAGSVGTPAGWTGRKVSPKKRPRFDVLYSPRAVRSWHRKKFPFTAVASCTSLCGYSVMSTDREPFLNLDRTHQWNHRNIKESFPRGNKVGFVDQRGRGVVVLFGGLVVRKFICSQN